MQSKIVGGKKFCRGDFVRDLEPTQAPARI